MQPVNLTMAFAVTQLFLLVIVFFGILVLRAGERKLSVYSESPRPATRTHPVLFAGFALLTLGLLIFSEEVLFYSKPVFGDVELPGIGRTNAFLFVFALDILGASFLIRITGGSKNSPFGAVLFTLPVLSIFLREPPGRFLWYTFAVAALFLLVQVDMARRDIEENPNHRAAFSFVTLGCLALSTMVGYATRPQ